ncbi:MAG: tetratricopeptide repeat protein [Verrucomicrobiales bacterium]
MTSRMVKLLGVALAVQLAAFAPQATALPKIFGFGKKDPDAAPGAAQLAEQEAKAMQRLAEGQAAEAKGDDSKARKIYEDIAFKYTFTKTAATAQFRAGQLFEKEGKRAKAFEAYQVLIDKHPQSAEYATALERQFNIVTESRTNRGGFLAFGRVGIDDLIKMYEQVIANGTRSPFAPKAQFAIGELHAESNELDSTSKSIAAFQKVVDTYPESPEAAEAAYKIGNVNYAIAKKSRDATGLTKAREAFESARTLFGQSPQAAEAGANLQQISDAEAEKSYNTGLFYEKKGQLKAAVIYYNEVLKCPGCQHFVDAKERLSDLSANDPKLLDSLAGIQIAQNDLAVPAKSNTKARPDYFGPPPPPERTRAPRMRVDDQIPFTPIEEPSLPAPDLPGVPSGPKMEEDLLLPPPPGRTPLPSVPGPAVPPEVPAATSPAPTPTPAPGT